MHAVSGNSVNLRFALPAAPLRPFVTTYYCTDAVCSPHEPWLEDYLHPEWANLRFLAHTEAQSVIGAGELRPCPDFTVTGPTSRAARFRLRSGRSWGIGLLPEGWAALFAVPAGDYADRFVDGLADPVFAAFAPLARALAASEGDHAAELELIENHMAALFASAPPVDPQIAALTAALVDPRLVAVADLAGRVGMNVRGLERLSRRAFGFPPKLLLRRQRFLRSLARFMLDPSLRWLGALDDRYHDQSHFVRDFHRFMGMSPSAYARLDKPLLAAAARARMAVAGAAVQGLHRPLASDTASAGRARQVLCKSRDLPLADARAYSAQPIRQVMTELDTNKQAALAAIAGAASLETLEEQRLAALGKKGWVSLALKTLGGMSPDERAAAAPAIQGARAEIAEAIEAKKAALEVAELEARLARETIDLTLPAAAAPKGSVHPVSQVMDELAEIFADLGFAVATGPEIEDDWHNFTALNMDETHPARAMHDTFYFPDRTSEGREILLRTHTSPVQIRAMLDQGAPIRIIAPGRVYRSDSDATHTPMFHQVEGLVVDKDIHLGHLKWTLETFFKAFFEREDIVLRLRPSYFPFTEPSVEVDVGYSSEGGRRVVGGHGDAPGHAWMELGGSGMVNARVLEFAGLDPAEWQGFAFGLGIDRIAMLKYGMNDLRAFFDGDPRWLRHYGFSPFDQPTLSAGVGARA